MPITNKGPFAQKIDDVFNENGWLNKQLQPVVSESLIRKIRKQNHLPKQSTVGKVVKELKKAGASVELEELIALWNQQRAMRATGTGYPLPDAGSDAAATPGAIQQKPASNLAGSAGEFLSRYGGQLDWEAELIFRIAVGVAVDEGIGVHSSQLLRAMRSALTSFQPSSRKIRIERLDRENSGEYLSLAKGEGAMERLCSGYLFSAVRRLLRTKGAGYRVTPQDLLNAVLENAQGPEARALRRILGK